MIERILNDIEELKKTVTRPLVIAGINMVLEIIKKHSKYNGWIPCSERLPKEKEMVIMSTYDSTCVGCMIGKEWYEADMFSYDSMTRKVGVIAWQPLPEPYTGDM